MSSSLIRSSHGVDERRDGRRGVGLLTAYVAVRFLTRFFHTRTLQPFAVYCLIAGIASIVKFA